MISRLLLAATLTLSLQAADTDYNGRWNIHVNTPRGRVWWLEVSGAGTGQLRGSFVGAPGGQVDPVSDIRIANGELFFSLKQHSFKARYENGRLSGSRISPDPLAFTATRAPELKDTDDGTWKPAPVVRLFDGRSTKGWNKVVATAPGWFVEDGLLKNEPKASDIVSSQKFFNFEAKVEFRHGKGSNSGIGLRGRYEIQIQDNFGQAPNAHGTGALYSRIAPSVNASRAPGEWQTMTIRLVGRTLTVVLNGTTIIDKQPVVGPTAITTDPNEELPGPITLQGDHGLVEFRTIAITPLKR